MTRKSAPNSNRQAHQPLAGFTLVEMLVSVALVLLMMTLFSSIFSMATNSVSTQRGISQNDQRARALTTLIRADFAHRTFRYPLPFAPGENAATSPTPFSSRSGYLYISTNDPYSGLDDLVQFTVSSDILTEDPDSSPYFGKAQMLSDRDQNTPLVCEPTSAPIQISPKLTMAASSSITQEAPPGPRSPTSSATATSTAVCSCSAIHSRSPADNSTNNPSASVATPSLQMLTATSGSTATPTAPWTPTNSPMTSGDSSITPPSAAPPVPASSACRL
ncbi:MAG UNVERIFIED_CONTAM: type II secretion system GspH family protein [Planctomycetaceae bacterium]